MTPEGGENTQDDNRKIWQRLVDFVKDQWNGSPFDPSELEPSEAEKWFRKTDPSETTDEKDTS